MDAKNERPREWETQRVGGHKGRGPDWEGQSVEAERIETKRV